MTSLLLNTFLVLLTLFFGAMAYYPLFARSEDTEQAVETYGEDIVMSIVPAPLGQDQPTPIGIARRGSTRPEHPGHVPAA